MILIIIIQFTGELLNMLKKNHFKIYLIYLYKKVAFTFHSKYTVKKLQRLEILLNNRENIWYTYRKLCIVILIIIILFTGELVNTKEQEFPL